MPKVYPEEEIKESSSDYELIEIDPMPQLPSLANLIIETFYQYDQRQFKPGDQEDLDNRRDLVIELIKDSTEDTLHFDLNSGENKFAYPLETNLVMAIADGLVENQSIKSVAFIGIEGNKTKLDKPAISNSNLKIIVQALEHNHNITSFVSENNRIGEFHNKKKGNIIESFCTALLTGGISGACIAGLYYSIGNPEIFGGITEAIVIGVGSGINVLPATGMFLFQSGLFVKSLREPSPHTNYTNDKSASLNNLINFYVDRNQNPELHLNLDQTFRLNELKQSAEIRALGDSKLYKAAVLASLPEINNGSKSLILDYLEDDTQAIKNYKTSFMSNSPSTPTASRLSRSESSITIQ